MGQVIARDGKLLQAGYKVEHAFNDYVDKGPITFVCKACHNEYIIPSKEDWYIVVNIRNAKDGSDRQYMDRTALCSELCAEFFIMSDL